LFNEKPLNLYILQNQITANRAPAGDERVVAFDGEAVDVFRHANRLDVIAVLNWGGQLQEKEIVCALYWWWDDES
jgi:hypothetical protein